MRKLVIGDIHGCARAFDTLLELAQPTSNNTLVLLGDYIDRGPDSCGVIETILKLSRQCTVIALGGNHEKMLLSARLDSQYTREWLLHGGIQTLQSYERRGYTGRIASESSDFDGAWKETIEHDLRPPLELAFPEAAAGIDWSAPAEFLDQELQEVCAVAWRFARRFLTAMNAMKDATAF